MGSATFYPNSILAGRSDWSVLLLVLTTVASQIEVSEVNMLQTLEVAGATI
jgi:hypothetical protein